MLRVQAVTGPLTATPGDRVTYRVASFTAPDPPPALAARVSWLVKSTSGAALAHMPRSGPDLQVTIPDSWGGETALVMPYLSAPSATIAVRTVIARQGAPTPSPVTRRREVEIVRDGARYYASVDGEPRLFVGTDVRYGNRRGLMNSVNPPGARYRPEDYEAAHGAWAWYLHPTIMCESKGHFTCLNTYDRACFTFGHMQLGAHTPNDNFVKFFREILGEPSALEYFPDLAVHDGLICCRNEDDWSPLESAADTANLMAYFNATPYDVDAAEVQRAARMVDWVIRHPAVRDAQVAFSVREQRRKLQAHARKVPLDGVTDKLCLVVLDILHQGRGSYATITRALQADDPFDALLSIGASQFGERIATLRAGIKNLEAAGHVGWNVFDRAVGDFGPPSGA
jgi:hypothetical protein